MRTKASGFTLIELMLVVARLVLDWRGRLIFHKASRAGLIVAMGGATCQPRH